MADTGAGPLRDLLHCQKRADGDDGWGNPLPGSGPFATQFTLRARMKPRTGGESVDAARLGGQQPYVVRVHNNSKTRLITVAWQLVDARDATRVFGVVSPPADPDGRNQWLEFLATEGAVS
jgi:head-tail adaptor